MITAAVQMQNLLYVVGALGVATFISALYVLHHRKPRSMEAGIESFHRELRALAPERRAQSQPPPADTSGEVATARPAKEDE